MRSSWPASGPTTTAEIVDRMADKLIGLRYFADAEGRTNLRSPTSAARSSSSASSRSTPTSAADGARFTDAAPPEQAIPLVDRFVEHLRAAGIRWRPGGSARRWQSSS